MLSYGVEKWGRGRTQKWVVCAYRDTARLYAVQDCFTLRQASAVAERLNRAL